MTKAERSLREEYKAISLLGKHVFMTSKYCNVYALKVS